MKHDWIDITFPISNQMVTWPGDPPVQLSKSSQIGCDHADANVTHLSMSAHTGTHIDAPLHFIENGKDIASLDLATLTGKVYVCPIENEVEITVAELQQRNMEGVDKILFKTVNSQKDWINSPFFESYVHLSTDAAQWLVNLGVTCIGIDYLSIGGMENGVAVHKILLGAGITILEGLNMKDVQPGLYEMVALPLKIIGADGAPARVLLREILNE